MLTDRIKGVFALKLYDMLFPLIPVTFLQTSMVHYISGFSSYSFCSTYEVDKINVSSPNIFASLIFLTMQHTKHPGHSTKIS